MPQETITFGTEAEYKAFVKGVMLSARGNPTAAINFNTAEAEEANGWKITIEHIFPINHADIFPVKGNITKP
jgi:hypothetical protein